MALVRASAGSAVILTLVSTLLCLPHAVSADTEGTSPPAPVLLDLPLSGAVSWLHVTDVGVMLVYAGDDLLLVDLLAEEPKVIKGMHLPGLAHASTLISVPGTGILITAGTESGEGRAESLAIDTLAGKVLWERPALGPSSSVIPFIEKDLLVLYRRKPSRRTLALDLATGETLWERTDGWRVWNDGVSLGLASDALYTIEPRAGTVLRKVDVPIENKQRLLVYPEAERAVVWDGRRFYGYDYPRYGGIPASGEVRSSTPQQLWKVKADSPMVQACIRGGGCDVVDAGPHRMLIRSALRYEIIDLADGKRLWARKRGMLRTTALEIAPSSTRAAIATSKGLELVDLTSGEVVHETRYPRGLSKGSKLMKRANWLDDKTVMTVFPDKKGEPRGLCAFSAETGEVLWSLELPKSARYNLTSDEQSKLFARIAFSLVMTAVSVSNPMGYGSASFVVVTVPNVHVRTAAAHRTDPDADPASLVLGERYAEAARRASRVGELRAERASRHRYYVTGWKGDHMIHRIDLADGSSTPLVAHKADAVHSIFPYPTHKMAVAIEDDKTRVRILGL